MKSKQNLLKPAQDRLFQAITMADASVNLTPSTLRGLAASYLKH